MSEKNNTQQSLVLDTNEITNEKLYNMLVKNFEEQKIYSKKRTFWMRVAAIACVAMLVIFLAGAAMLMPSITNAFNDIDAIAQSIEKDQLVDIINDVQAFSGNAVSITDQLGGLIKDISAVAEGIGSIDFEGLNDAIYALRGTIQPLANFFAMMG